MTGPCVSPRSCRAAATRDSGFSRCTTTQGNKVFLRSTCLQRLQRPKPTECHRQSAPQLLPTQPKPNDPGVCTVGFGVSATLDAKQHICQTRRMQLTRRQASHHCTLQKPINFRLILANTRICCIHSRTIASDVATLLGFKYSTRSPLHAKAARNPGARPSAFELKTKYRSGPVEASVGGSSVPLKLPSSGASPELPS